MQCRPGKLAWKKAAAHARASQGAGGSYLLHYLGKYLSTWDNLPSRFGASAQSKASERDETSDRLGPRRDASRPRRMLLRAWIGATVPYCPRIICRRADGLTGSAPSGLGDREEKNLSTAVQQPRFARPPFIPPPRSQYGEDGEQIMKAAATADQVP